MNATQKPVAVAMNVAGAKVANVAKSAKRPSKTKLHKTRAEWVKLCTQDFATYLTVDDTLAQAAFQWKAARMQARASLEMAHADIGDGEPWQAFKSEFADSLVTCKIVADRKAAQRLINNALIALGLTGRGTRKGGKKAGRKAKATATVTNATDDAPNRLAAAVLFVGTLQTKYQGEPDILADLGELAAILGRKVK